MSQLHLSDEILMAFADGELDEPVAAAVEQAMASNPAVAKRIVDFLRSRRLTRAAFASQAPLDVPPKLHAAVSDKINAVEHTRNQAPKPAPTQEPRLSWIMKGLPSKLLLAASVAAVAAMGYFAGQQSLRSRNPGGLITTLDNPLIQAALDQSASGQDVVLPLGQVRIISTHRLANGSLCREFSLRAASDRADVVACRSNGWNVTFALARAADNAAYIPSDGTDLVSTYLQKIGAGEPLVDAAEINALGEHDR